MLTVKGLQLYTSAAGAAAGTAASATSSSIALLQA
jgi:hypothetical protein